MATTVSRWLASALIVAGLTGAASGATTLVFSEPDFVWHQTGGLATPYHIWVAGDYWAQAFPGTTQAVTDEMWLTLFVNSNYLTSGNQLSLNVILNSNVVGSFSIASGATGTQTYHFSFSPLTGPDYSIQLLAANTVPPLGGSVSIGLDGQSYVTLVPEPASLALLACVLLRRRPR